MKIKSTLIASLTVFMVSITTIGTIISLCYCMKWNIYSQDLTLPPQALKFAHNMIIHAYFWMGISFVFLCLIVIMQLWFFFHKQKLHPELIRLITNTSECTIQEIKTNIYTNEITISGKTTKSRRQLVTLLDYLLKAPHHEISYLELNTIFDENFFNNSPASRRKISNIKYEINDLLKDSEFELIKIPTDKLSLIRTKETNQCHANE